MDHCWLSDYPFLFVWLVFPPRLREYEAFLGGRVVVIILSLATVVRFILTAWLLSLVPSVPNLFIFTTTGEPQAQECVSDFSEWNSVAKKGYFSAVFLVIFVIPLVSSVELNNLSPISHGSFENWSINHQKTASLCTYLSIESKHIIMDHITHINIFYAKVYKNLISLT